jgi:hypothetical protein
VARLLGSVSSQQVLQTLQYKKAGGQQTTKSFRSRTGEVAEAWEDIAKLIQDEAFPILLEGVQQKAPENGGDK